jgi:hypothetical protein
MRKGGERDGYLGGNSVVSSNSSLFKKAKLSLILRMLSVKGRDHRQSQIFQFFPGLRAFLLHVIGFFLALFGVLFTLGRVYQ